MKQGSEKRFIFRPDSCLASRTRSAIMKIRTVIGTAIEKLCFPRKLDSRNQPGPLLSQGGRATQRQGTVVVFYNMDRPGRSVDSMRLYGRWCAS